MEEEIRRVFEADPRIAFALVFGSTARRERRPDSDLDVAIGLVPGARLDTLEFGGIVSDLEAAAKIEVDVVVLERAPSPLAFRVFRDGNPIYIRDRSAFVRAKVRAFLEYLDFKPIEEQLTAGVFRRASRRASNVDRAVVAVKVAAVEDAVSRIHDVLPVDVAAFLADRTSREVVILNLFVAIEESISLATQWVSDEGLGAPQTYAEVFALLASNKLIDAGLARRLGQAAGLRNLVAHRYGHIEWERVFSLAQKDLADLTSFCGAVVRHTQLEKH